jgi:hypothetical protein
MVMVMVMMIQDVMVYIYYSKYLGKYLGTAQHWAMG